MGIFEVLTVLVGLVPVVAGGPGQEHVGDLEAGSLFPLGQLFRVHRLSCPSGLPLADQDFKYKFFTQKKCSAKKRR